MRGVRVNLFVFSFHFNRTDIETVIHSDNGFAAVSYLRIKGATLEEKQESGNDLTVPPLLEPDFVQIQTLLRGHHFADTSIHTVPEPVACQPTVQSHSLSASRKGSWVAVGNVCCATGHDIAFEEEVVQCFRDLQGISASIGEALF